MNRIFKREKKFKKTFPIIKPTIEPLEGSYLLDLKSIYDSRMLTNSKWVKLFESKLHYVHDTEVTAMSSCTSGLILTLEALKVQGKKVITPSFGFVATCQAIYYSKNEVLFVDIDDSLLLDPKKVRNILKNDTKKEIGAIIPVHMYGLECHVKEFDAIGKEFAIPVIFDSAHMIGNKEAVQYGDAHILSFSPTKLITTFEGGVVLTNDPVLQSSLQLLRNYGNPLDYYTKGHGLSARMTEVSALHGVYQLHNINTYLANRNRYVELYKENLKGIDIEFQEIPDGYKTSNKDFSIFTNFPSAIEFAWFLDNDNIQTKYYFYPPLHKTEPFYSKCSLPITVKKANHVLSLPIHNVMEESDIIKICDAIKDVAALDRMKYIDLKIEDIKRWM